MQHVQVFEHPIHRWESMALICEGVDRDGNMPHSGIGGSVRKGGKMHKVPAVMLENELSR
jgi:hypothetical protein